MDGKWRTALRPGSAGVAYRETRLPRTPRQLAGAPRRETAGRTAVYRGLPPALINRPGRRGIGAMPAFHRRSGDRDVARCCSPCTAAPQANLMRLVYRKSPRSRHGFGPPRTPPAVGGRCGLEPVRARRGAPQRAIDLGICEQARPPPASRGSKQGSGAGVRPLGGTWGDAADHRARIHALLRRVRGRLSRAMPGTARTRPRRGPAAQVAGNQLTLSIMPPRCRKVRMSGVLDGEAGWRCRPGAISRMSTSTPASPRV